MVHKSFITIEVRLFAHEQMGKKIDLCQLGRGPITLTPISKWDQTLLLLQRILGYYGPPTFP